MTRADAEKAITSAEMIANGPWLPLWRYGVPSQSEAVRDVLKPAHEYIEWLDEQLYNLAPQEPEGTEYDPDDSPKALVEKARARLGAIQARAAMNGVLRAISRTREHT